MSSFVSGQVVPPLGAYGAAKAGLDLLPTTQALEFGPSGVRVNAVAPGSIRTPAAALAGEMFEQSTSATPMDRAGTADEIATAITDLVSDDASYQRRRLTGRRRRERRLTDIDCGASGDNAIEQLPAQGLAVGNGGTPPRDHREAIDGFPRTMSVSRCHWLVAVFVCQEIALLICMRPVSLAVASRRDDLGMPGKRSNIGLRERAVGRLCLGLQPARVYQRKAQAVTVAEIFRAAWLPHDGLVAPPNAIDDSGWHPLVDQQRVTEATLLQLRRADYTWVVLELVRPRSTHRSASNEALLWRLA